MYEKYLTGLLSGQNMNNNQKEQLVINMIQIFSKVLVSSIIFYCRKLFLKYW